MKPKRLLIVHPSIAPYRVDFFNFLYEKYNCEIIIWQKSSDSHIINYTEFEKQFQFVPKYMVDRYGNLKLPKGLLKEMRNFHPDIILCNEFNPITITAIFYKSLFNHNCKIVTMMDDSYDMVAGGTNFSFRHVLAKKIILPMVNQVICVEPRVQHLLQKKYGMGLTFPIITEDNKFRDKLRKALSISEQYVKKYSLENKKVLLFVGRLVELKNVQKIIPLFLSLNCKDYVLIIVGSGPIEQELKLLSNGAENIIFQGKLEGMELMAWYNIAQIFILASTIEAFGAVTNEALLGGCYSLVSKLAGSQSLISPGINGEIINPFSSEDIANKMMESFQKVENLSLPLKLRDNMMKTTFDKYINDLIANIDNL